METTMKEPKPSTQLKRLWKRDDTELPLRQWARRNLAAQPVRQWANNKGMKL